MLKINKNKKAWIRIVEAFIAILMIVGILAVIVTKDISSKNDRANLVHEEEFYILQKIQLNSSLRQDILTANIIPIESTNANFPFDFQEILNVSALKDFNCTLKICVSYGGCILEDLPQEKEAYAKSILINCDLNIYNPRELAIFCWKN